MEVISKSDAKAAGLLRYFTGKPCKNGHICERYANSGGCVSCRSEIARKWNIDNPDKTAEYGRRYTAKNPERRNQQRKDAAKRWRDRNPEKHRQQVKDSRIRNSVKIAARNKRWNKENREWIRKYNRLRRNADPEKFRKYFRQWEANNPERAAHNRRASKVNRRTRERENGGHCTPDDIAFLMNTQKGKCAGCDERKPRLEVDHILSVARGGTSDRTNLQLLCRRCNASKGTRDMLEWAQEHGFLNATES